MNLKFVVVAFALVSMSAAQAQAAAQNIQALETAIQQALSITNTSTVTYGPVEGAKFMQSCTRPLEVIVTGNAPFEEAAVHCASPSWTLYVSVTVTIHALIAVAARQIAAGQVFQPGDVQLQSEPLSLYAGRQVFYDIENLVGATASMSFPIGTILTSGNIQQPIIIHAGQNIGVNIVNGNVDVSLTAVATQNGRVGDTILLTNPTTGKHFPALVTANGPVINLGY